MKWQRCRTALFSEDTQRLRFSNNNVSAPNFNTYSILHTLIVWKPIWIRVECIGNILTCLSRICDLCIGWIRHRNSNPSNKEIKRQAFIRNKIHTWNLLHSDVADHEGMSWTWKMGAWYGRGDNWCKRSYCKYFAYSNTTTYFDHSCNWDHRLHGDLDLPSCVSCVQLHLLEFSFESIRKIGDNNRDTITEICLHIQIKF